MKYLSKEIFGNPVENWLIAIGILFGALSLLKSFIGSFQIFSKITSKTTNSLDDTPLRTLQKPQLLFW